MRAAACTHDDRGATAVLTAVLAVVLFGFAALGVELTSMYSRDRAAQTTADLAALAAAQDLPDGCAAVVTAVRYVRENPVLFTDTVDSLGSAAALRAVLTNGDDADGEVRVHDAGDLPTAGDDEPNTLSGCPGTVAGDAVTVLTPPRTVEFAFAAVLGVSRGRVAAEATAAQSGGVVGNLLPLGLPRLCGNGLQVLKAGSGGSSGPDETVAGCADSSTGNFGLLESPRRSEDRNDWRFYNLAYGLDHGIRPFAEPPDPVRACTRDGTPAGAVLDDDPWQDTANCLNVLPGNKVSLVMDALVQGSGGGPADRIPGRLSGPSRPAPGSSCTEPGGGGADSDRGDLRWTVPKNRAVSITNTVLSCYLLGASIGELAQDDPPAGVLDERILSDPRFFTVPVMAPGARERNGFWPVIGYKGAFITDESPVSPGGSCSSDTDCNGLRFTNGGTQLQQVTVFVFDIGAIRGVTDASSAEAFLVR